MMNVIRAFINLYIDFISNSIIGNVLLIVVSILMLFVILNFILSLLGVGKNDKSNF